jgi:hypothetical protein
MQTLLGLIDRSLTNDGIVTYTDKTWEELRDLRDNLLKATDSYYPKDRWDSFNTTQKGQLNTWREDLRDLPANYNTANEAWDAITEPPSFVNIQQALKQR